MHISLWFSVSLLAIKVDLFVLYNVEIVHYWEILKTHVWKFHGVHQDLGSNLSEDKYPMSKLSNLFFLPFSKLIILVTFKTDTSTIVSVTHSLQALHFIYLGLSKLKINHYFETLYYPSQLYLGLFKIRNPYLLSQV